MCFDAEPQAIVTESPLGSNRELMTVSLDGNHWATCPDREQFKRRKTDRPRARR